VTGNSPFGYPVIFTIHGSGSQKSNFNVNASVNSFSTTLAPGTYSVETTAQTIYFWPVTILTVPSNGIVSLTIQANALNIPSPVNGTTAYYGRDWNKGVAVPGVTHVIKLVSIPDNADGNSEYALDSVVTGGSDGSYSQLLASPGYGYTIDGAPVLTVSPNANNDPVPFPTNSFPQQCDRGN
jgi:hypothetical protein